jgi:hypothetical protein
MIPGFSAGGVLPPFIGAPAASSQQSPYPAGIREVVGRFASSTKRCEILRGWLNHRAALHALGFVAGFQWVNGSFCEQLAAREPNDVDLVTFLVPPPAIDLQSVMASHPETFVPRLTKLHYLCDVYGRPVHGTAGIDARFTSAVISAYQDLIAKTLAAKSDLRAIGPVPEAHLSRLHVTDVIRGSFGFKFQELTEQASFGETALFEAAEEAAHLIDAAGRDDEAFVDVVEGLNPRAVDPRRLGPQAVRCPRPGSAMDACRARAQALHAASSRELIAAELSHVVVFWVWAQGSETYGDVACCASSGASAGCE